MCCCVEDIAGYDNHWCYWEGVKPHHRCKDWSGVTVSVTTRGYIDLLEPLGMSGRCMVPKKVY